MAVNTFHYGAAPLLTPPPIADLQQLRESCIESHSLVGAFKLDERAWANEPAETSLQLLIHRIMRAFKAQPKTSCTSGIIAGIAASLFTKNPFPFLMGTSECFSRVSAQQTVGNEFLVNTYVLDSQANPSVASFRNGNFIVTWWSDLQDGSNYGIYGQLFDNIGNKIGNEFQVNTYTTDRQQLASVASFSNGNFVVTWMYVLKNSWQSQE